ncbi:MAG: hypothetical protein AAGD22_13280 [Verrucomicrobiota bacterium]
MKFGQFFLVTLAIAYSATSAETFVDREIGVSLTTPEGWVEDDASLYGMLLTEGSDDARCKVRIHLADKSAGSPEEAMEATFAMLRIEADAAASLLYSERVETESGIKGLKAAQGDCEYSKVPGAVHNYSPSPSGRIFCVCASVLYDEKTEQSYEAAVLKGLRYLVEQDQDDES